MYHRWAALALVLALWCLAPESAAGQSARPDQQPRGRKSGTLGQNYPNPSIRRPTSPSRSTARRGRGDHVVSVRIYNVLAQLVAIPIAQDSGEPLDKIKLACGDHVGYWDGKVRRAPDARRRRASTSTSSSWTASGRRRRCSSPSERSRATGAVALASPGRFVVHGGRPEQRSPRTRRFGSWASRATPHRHLPLPPRRTTCGTAVALVADRGETTVLEATERRLR